jgi:hypothetical protein
LVQILDSAKFLPGIERETEKNIPVPKEHGMSETG